MTSPTQGDGLEVWLTKRCARALAAAEVQLDDQGLDGPEYRRLLGQHQAYMHVRSYIRGGRRAHLQAKEE